LNINIHHAGKQSLKKPNPFSEFLPQGLTAAHNVTPKEVRQKRAGMGQLDRLHHSDLWKVVS